MPVICPDTCPDGSKLQCTQFQEEQYNCLEGLPVDTGVTRLVGEITSSGTCPVQPQDCGSHANASNWWSEIGSVSRVCELCADGTPHNCLKSQEGESVCHNGTVSSTGNLRDGNFLSYTNECLPVKPRDCGSDHPDATSWWEEQGTIQASCQTCYDGSKLNCNYANEIQKTCSNGDILTGGSRQGRYLNTIGECPTPPRQSCGAIPDGGLEWMVGGQSAAYDCDICLDGSRRQCIRSVENEMKCDNGNLGATGATRDGAFIGYVTNCPTDITEHTQSVTVGQTVGKADVLFVLDTTPSAFLSLNNLGTRFQQLISRWSRVDWQIGITNAKMEQTLFDRPALQGAFMPLQTNDETKPASYIIKRGDYFANDWFYRTVSRDPSDDLGCENQPYCMMNPPEPMKSAMAAMDKKDIGVNKGFFRDGAELVVVTVTTSDERQVGASDPKATKAADVVAHFQAKLGGKMAGMVGMTIGILPNDKACLDHLSNLFDLGLGGKYSVVADQFAKLTGGVSASVCDKDYGPALAKLSESIRQQVQSLTLDDVPYGNSLTITFTPAQPGLTWVVRGKKVLFNQAIPAGTRIDVRYLVKTN
jgi:hypothetical protein